MTQLSVKPYQITLAGMSAVTTAIIAYSVWASHNGASPCPLCIFQRMLFMTVLAIATLGLAMPRSLSRAVTGGMLAVSLGGFAVAAYQSFMQEFPGRLASCGYSDPTLIESIVDWAGDISPYFFLATGFCEHKDIALLGVSWAQLSAAAFMAISVTAVWLFLSNRNQNRGIGSARA